MFKSIWNGFKWLGDSLQSPLLLVLRLYWGYQFAVTGYGKLLNLGGVSEYFQSLGIPFPYLNALLAGSTEFIGGTLLFVGLFSRIIPIPLLGVMLVAYITTASDSLISLFLQFNPEPFFRETPFLFAYATLLVFCFGPGKISVDYWFTGAYKNKEMP